MYLKHTGFTYSACGSFIKNKERVQKFKGNGDTKYIFKMNQIILVLKGDFKDLARRTASDKGLRDKAFNIA